MRKRNLFSLMVPLSVWCIAGELLQALARLVLHDLAVALLAAVTRLVRRAGERHRRPARAVVAGELLKALAGLALYELADALLGAVTQLVRRAVEQHLRLARAQPRQRVEHDDPVSDLQDRLHVVRDHEAGHRPALPG